MKQYETIRITRRDLAAIWWDMDKVKDLPWDKACDIVFEKLKKRKEEED